MSFLAITCDNCGAKYKLPESFSGDKAKCSKCGSAIDVAAQRKQASAPAPAAPAPKAPAAQQKAPRAPREPAAAKPRPSARSAAEADAPRASRRKGAEAPAPKKGNMGLLIGAAVVALGGVGAVLMMGGDSKPQAQQTAMALAAAPKAMEAAPDSAAQSAPKEQPAASKPSEPATPAQSPQADPAATPAAKPADQAAEAVTPKPAANDAAKGEPKERWERNTTTSLDAVYDPSNLGSVQWPGDIDDAQKAEVQSLVDDVVQGGKAGISAKPKITEMGYPALFALIEKLRQLDYKSADDQMTAWELNKLIESITITINAGFVPVEMGGDLDPRKADHNAKTNQAWARLLDRFPDKASFEAFRKEKLNRNK